MALVHQIITFWSSSAVVGKLRLVVERLDGVVVGRLRLVVGSLDDVVVVGRL